MPSPIKAVIVNFIRFVSKSDIIISEIKQLVEKNLARFSWPVAYEFRDELPKTLVGKVAYNVLIHEEEMKSKSANWDNEEELLEQVEDDNNDELVEEVKE